MLQSRHIAVRGIVLNGRGASPDLAESTNPAALARMLPGLRIVEVPHQDVGRPHWRPPPRLSIACYEEAARRQSIRNRHPLFSCGDRAGSADRRRLQLRGSLFAASIQGGRSVSDRSGRGRRAGSVVSEHPGHHRRRPPARRGCDSSRLRLSVGERRVRARLRGGGPDVRRSDAGTARRVRRQGGVEAAGSRRRRADRARHGARGRRVSTTSGQRPRRSVIPSSSKPASAAAAAACASCRTPTSWRGSSKKRSAKRRRRSDGPMCSSSVSSAGRSTSKSRFSATRTAISCTCGSAIARFSGAIRRSSRSRPASTCPRDLRVRICDAAVRLCQAVRYRSAGTVEFLVDMDREEFFFIEVNPRIQVEHTVTEVVTGIDLVRSQILIAQGHRAARRAALDSAAGRDPARAGWPCSAASRPRIRKTTSFPTTAASPPIDRRADLPSGSTAATGLAARSSRRTSTRCSSR